MFVGTRPNRICCIHRLMSTTWPFVFSFSRVFHPLCTTVATSHGTEARNICPAPERSSSGSGLYSTVVVLLLYNSKFSAYSTVAQSKLCLRMRRPTHTQYLVAPGIVLQIFGVDSRVALVYVCFGLGGACVSRKKVGLCRVCIILYNSEGCVVYRQEVLERRSFIS